MFVRLLNPLHLTSKVYLHYISDAKSLSTLTLNPLENLGHCFENVEKSYNSNSVNFSVNIFIYFALGVSF